VQVLGVGVGVFDWLERAEKVLVGVQLGQLLDGHTDFLAHDVQWLDWLVRIQRRKVRPEKVEVHAERTSWWRGLAGCTPAAQQRLRLKPTEMKERHLNLSFY
jgi:hypothetical protein